MADDGWIHVKKSKKSRAPQPVNGQNPPSRELTVEKIIADFHTKTKVWQQSACRMTLLSLLDRVRPDGGWQLDKAVCLGSGSLSRDNPECRRRSMWQMVAFADIVKQFNVRSEVYAQDPSYTALDEAFFSTIGLQLLRLKAEDARAMGPAADIISPGTFLFEPFVDMSAGMVREMLDKHVGLYMGSSIRGLIEKGTRAATTKESQARLAHAVEAGNLAKQFCEGMEMYYFPVFDVDPNVFEGIGIHLKSTDDEEDQS